MYGMYLLQEAIRQQRGTAPHQVKGRAACGLQGIGGMFGASGTIVMADRRP